MAFSITNKTFAVEASSFLPSCHQEIADLTLVSGTVTSATVNTAVEGLQWVRLRALAKTLTGMQAGDTLTVTVQAGTGAAITGPTNLVQRTVRMIAGDTALLVEGLGWSNAGVQSYAVTVQGRDAGGTLDTGITAVVDVMLDFA